VACFLGYLAISPDCDLRVRRGEKRLKGVEQVCISVTENENALVGGCPQSPRLMAILLAILRDFLLTVPPPKKPYSL
jgi:hypothetical protein